MKGSGSEMVKEAGFLWSVLKRSRVVPQLTRTWSGWDAYWDSKPMCSICASSCCCTAGFALAVVSGAGLRPMADTWKMWVTNVKNIVKGALMFQTLIPLF